MGISTPPTHDILTPIPIEKTIYIFFQYFKKLQNFHKISKLTYFIRFQKIKKKFKILRKFSKFQNLYIMNLIFFLKIGFAEIPYINNGLLVYLVFSMGMGVNISWVGGGRCLKNSLLFNKQLLTFNFSLLMTMWTWSWVDCIKSQ
jgi:hypothetical protein